METTKESAPTSDLEKHLGYWLRRVSNTVSGEFARSLQARQTSVAEWVLCRHLYDKDQATPSEMAENLTMTRGAISKVIDKLEAKGWIKSRVDPEDHRGRHLSLTALGRRTVPELAKIADRNDEEFFACLDAGDRDTLRRLLVKVAEHHQMQDTPVN